MSYAPFTPEKKRPSLFFWVRVIVGLCGMAGLCAGLAFTALALWALATGEAPDLSLSKSLLILIPSSAVLYLCVESARRDEKHNVPE